MQTAGDKIYWVLFRTGAVGLRCGEAVCRKREGINVDAASAASSISGESPGGRDSPGQVYVRTQQVHLPKRYIGQGLM